MLFEEELRQAKGKYLPRCPALKNRKCDGHCEGKEFKCVRCRRWRPYCFGGSDGDECTKCWVEIRDAIVDFVTKATFRREDTITTRFGLSEKESTLSPRRVEDILFDLVQEGRLEWFGAEEGTRGSGVLRYRCVINPKAVDALEKKLAGNK